MEIKEALTKCTKCFGCIQLVSNQSVNGKGWKVYEQGGCYPEENSHGGKENQSE